MDFSARSLASAPARKRRSARALASEGVKKGVLATLDPRACQRQRAGISGRGTTRG